MSDLIERLRAFEIDTGSGGFEPEVCHEAADEIERLQARVEALEGAVHSARAYILPWTRNCDYRAEVDLKDACKMLLAATEQEGE